MSEYDKDCHILKSQDGEILGPFDTYSEASDYRAANELPLSEWLVSRGKRAEFDVDHEGLAREWVGWLNSLPDVEPGTDAYEYLEARQQQLLDKGRVLKDIDQLGYARIAFEDGVALAQEVVV